MGFSGTGLLVIALELFGPVVTSFAAFGYLVRTVVETILLRADLVEFTSARRGILVLAARPRTDVGVNRQAGHGSNHGFSGRPKGSTGQWNLVEPLGGLQGTGITY